MIGIAGVFGVEDPGEVEHCRRTLAGSFDEPEHVRAWSGGLVALAAVGRHTRDGRPLGAPPLLHREGMVLVGDLRIDNREELGRSLRWQHPPGPANDLELFADAWRRWSEDALVKVVGDFSVAVWDESTRTLHVARDFPGVRPLVWWQSGRRFAFGPSPSTLLRLPFVHAAPDELAVGRYLVATEQDEATTYFEGIRRVLPGQVIRVDPHGAAARKFYRLADAALELDIPDAEAEERFRSLFIEAVRCRATSDGTVAAELSGGIDSSSVVGTMRHLGWEGFAGYSMVFPGESRDVEFAELVARDAGIQRVIAGELSMHDRGALRSLVGEPGSPVTVDGPPHSGDVHIATARDGVDILLTGVDGDNTVSHGYRYLTELFVHGRVVSLVREATALARRSDFSRTAVLRSSTAGVLLPPAVLSGLKRALGRPDVSVPPLIGEGLRRRVGRDPHHAWRMPGRSALSTRTFHIENLEDRTVSEYLEVLDLSAQRQAIDVRHPYSDRRLLEFCAGLPGDQMLREGWTRSIQRRGLRGLVPDEVRLRQDKGALGDRFFPTIVQGLRAMDPRGLEHPSRSMGYLDPVGYRSALANSDVDSVCAAVVWGVARLEWWMEAWGLES